MPVAERHAHSAELVHGPTGAVSPLLNNPRSIPTADESMVVIRFANPKGIDFAYLLNMINDSFMSRANTIVVPGGKMELAMQLIFTPFIWRLTEKRRKALAA